MCVYLFVHDIVLSYVENFLYNNNSYIVKGVVYKCHAWWMNFQLSTEYSLSFATYCFTCRKANLFALGLNETSQTVLFSRYSVSLLPCVLSLTGGVFT